MTVRFLVLFGWAICAHAEDDQTLRIGVFDPPAAGGQGAKVDGLVRGLDRHGFEAEAISDLGLLTLIRYDIVYLSDVHHPGKVHEDWRKTLKQFVASGGSVLQTWHHHVLGEVSVGIRRIYDDRRMHVQPGHPAVAGMGDFNASFKDHIIERVGPRGTVLLKNAAGQPVAAAGRIGKGKVICTGLALAIPNGRQTREPRGAELKLLKGFLTWLKPDVPRGDRLADALKTPRLEVSATEVLTAAGFPAHFEACVANPDAGDAQLTCQGTGAPAPTVKLRERIGARMSVFTVDVPTPPGKDGEHLLAVRAKIGDRTLEETVQVSCRYAKPPANERRGVWLHVRPDRHPKTVMPELRKLGIKMAILRIAGGTAAFYASKVQPDVQDPLAPDGDWLADAVKHAHANGIEIHPYVNNCIVQGRTSRASLERLRAEGRLQVSPDGKVIAWFCPSQEANVAAIERPMIEIVTRYDVDGIQYDFIRYPNASGCFCDKCRARFEAEMGKRVQNWPQDVLDGPRRDEWIEFRCDRISALVKRISTRIRQVAPKVKISAAVFSRWPDCRVSNGQDWVRWCKEGWLDFVCPMNYHLDPKVFAERAAIHRQVVPKDVPILQGIGIHSGQGQMNGPAELAVQIALARKHGASGFVGFCYTPKHTASLFAPLRDWLRGR